MSIFLILGGILRKEAHRFSIGCWLIIIFWILYAVRLVYDREFLGIRFSSYTPFKFYSFAFGNGFLAALAGILTMRFVNIYKAKKFIFLTILLSNISILLICVYLFKTINPVDLGARLSFTFELDGKKMDILNPITIAYHGELLALLSLISISGRKWQHSLLFSGFFILGLFVLLLGASRGPLISFAVISFFILIAKLYTARKSSVFFAKLFAYPIVALFIFLYGIAPKIDWSNLTVFKRIEAWMTGSYAASLDNRDDKYLFAWNQFVENPIIGDQFVDKLGGYPHNLFLESLMALGLIGGSIFFSLIIYTLYKVFFLVINKYQLLEFSILSLSVILASITSGSLFASYGFWIVLAYFAGISRKNYSELKP